MSAHSQEKKLQEPCPFLPIPEKILDAEALSALKDHRGERFYAEALRYAQSLWIQGFPARSLLILDRAMGAELNGDENELQCWLLPYSAIAWILKNAKPYHYLGNPRVHYQHLATRVRGPRSILRQWRAWGCWWIARRQMPHLPPDPKQIIQEPSHDEIKLKLEQFGLPEEVQHWQNAIK